MAPGKWGDVELLAVVEAVCGIDAVTEAHYVDYGAVEAALAPAAAPISIEQRATLLVRRLWSRAPIRIEFQDEIARRRRDKPDLRYRHLNIAPELAKLELALQCAAQYLRTNGKRCVIKISSDMDVVKDLARALDRAGESLDPAEAKRLNDEVHARLQEIFTFTAEDSVPAWEGGAATRVGSDGVGNSSPARRRLRKVSRSPATIATAILVLLGGATFGSHELWPPGKVQPRPPQVGVSPNNGNDDTQFIPGNDPNQPAHVAASPPASASIDTVSNNPTWPDEPAFVEVHSDLVDSQGTYQRNSTVSGPGYQITLRVLVHNSGAAAIHGLQMILNSATSSSGLSRAYLVYLGTKADGYSSAWIIVHCTAVCRSDNVHDGVVLTSAFRATYTIPVDTVIGTNNAADKIGGTAPDGTIAPGATVYVQIPIDIRSHQ